ncbi:hypothetical protein DFP73DRAFT_629502, partial [Morchella snyderi]
MFVDEDHCLNRHAGLPSVNGARATENGLMLLEKHISLILYRISESQGDRNCPQRQNDWSRETFRLRLGTCYAQLPRCSIPLAKAVIRSLPHEINSKDERKPDQARSSQDGNVTAHNSTIHYQCNHFCRSDPGTLLPGGPSSGRDIDSDTEVEEDNLPTPESDAIGDLVGHRATTVFALHNITNRLDSRFSTGISLMACYQLNYPHLSLFFAVPYLSESSDGWKKLSVYNGSTSSARSPAFHCQERAGAYHALTQMILATVSATFSTDTLHETSHLLSDLAVFLDQIKVLEDLTRLYRDSLSRNMRG